MNKYIKHIILLLHSALVFFLIAFASGYTQYTDCDYYKLKRSSIIPILVIALLSFVVGLVLKMKKDTRYIFVVSVSMISFFLMSHFYEKKQLELLKNNDTIITKAIIFDIEYQQFTTFILFKTTPKKFKASKDLKKKSDLGNLKIGDTILIKYAMDCYAIFNFHNLSPTKEELAKY